MIRPSQAEAIERQLINLARSGQLTRKLGDDELRSMLEQVSVAGVLIVFHLHSLIRGTFAVALSYFCYVCWPRNGSYRPRNQNPLNNPPYSPILEPNR